MVLVKSVKSSLKFIQKFNIKTPFKDILEIAVRPLDLEPIWWKLRMIHALPMRVKHRFEIFFLCRLKSIGDEDFSYFQQVGAQQELVVQRPTVITSAAILKSV
jgi:hypothetical protein